MVGPGLLGEERRLWRGVGEGEETMVSLGGLAGWLAARRGFLSFPSFVGWFTWIGRSAPSLLGSITPSEIGRAHV